MTPESTRPRGIAVTLLRWGAHTASPLQHAACANPLGPPILYTVADDGARKGGTASPRLRRRTAASMMRHVINRECRLLIKRPAASLLIIITISLWITMGIADSDSQIRPLRFSLGH